MWVLCKCSNSFDTSLLLQLGTNNGFADTVLIALWNSWTIVSKIHKTVKAPTNLEGLTWFSSLVVGVFSGLRIELARCTAFNGSGLLWQRVGIRVSLLARVYWFGSLARHCELRMRSSVFGQYTDSRDWANAVAHGSIRLARWLLWLALCFSGEEEHCTLTWLWWPLLQPPDELYGQLVGSNAAISLTYSSNNLTNNRLRKITLSSK